MTTVATQPIKDFISEVAFNEWKAGLIAKAKSLLPSIISESYKAELDLDQANDIANQLFSKLQNTNEKAFKESLDLVRSLISAYSNRNAVSCFSTRFHRKEKKTSYELTI